jgi:hypothetical protein
VTSTPELEARPPERRASALIDTAMLAAALRQPDDAVGVFREALAAANRALAERFHDNQPIETLVNDNARMVDAVI